MIINGIVMEVHKNHIIVMTAEGDFYKEKISTYDIVDLGMEISYDKTTASDFVSNLARFIPKLKVAVPAMLAVVLTLSGLPLISKDDTAFAHISMDVNPSFELEVNKSGEVISINHFNDDGKRVVKEIDDWEYKPLDYVVEESVKILRDLGYLLDDNHVIISSSTVAQGDNYTVDFEGLENEMMLDVVYYKIPSEVHDKAIASGASPGKYAAWLQSGKQDSTIKLADLCEKSVKDIVSLLNIRHIALVDEVVEYTEESIAKDINVIDKPNSRADAVSKETELPIQQINYNNSTEEVLTSSQQSTNVAVADIKNNEASVSKSSRNESPNKQESIFRSERDTDSYSKKVSSKVKDITKPNKQKPSSESKKDSNKNKKPSNSTIGKQETQRPVINIATRPAKPKPTPSTPKPSTPNIKDEYVAGNEYEEHKPKPRPTTTPDIKEPEENDAVGSNDTNETPESSPEPPISNEEDTSSDTDVDGSDIQDTTSSDQDGQNSCSKDGYYLTTENVLFFEVNEAGEVIEVWKEIEVKKAC